MSAERQDLYELAMRLDDDKLARAIKCLVAVRNKPEAVKALTIRRDGGLLTDQEWLEAIENLSQDAA